MWPTGFIQYPHAYGESLKVIDDILHPTEEDIVGAVCGSGEAPAILLRHGAQVFAYDTNSNQIKYAQRRINALKNKDYAGFLQQRTVGLSPLSMQNCEYLSTPEILGDIEKHIDNLSLEPGDITLTERKYTRLYLSNIRCIRPTAFKIDEFIERVSKMVLPGGIVYFSDVEKNPILYLLGSLELDEERTYHARENSPGLKPAVYRLPQIFTIFSTSSQKIFASSTVL